MEYGLKPTDLTLMEQINLTDREIARRKHLFDFVPEDEARLLAVKPFIEREMDTIIQRFYDKQLENPEVYNIIGDSETLVRLKLAMRGYVESLFGGVLPGRICQ